MSESKATLGDRIYNLLAEHQGRLFNLGRSAQLSYAAFQQQAVVLQQDQRTEIPIKYPLGLRPDGSVIPGDAIFPKEALIAHYNHLANAELAVTSTYHLVTLTEVLFSDVVSSILSVYPKKIGTKRQLPVIAVFEADSLEAARASAIASFCNDLSYLSPKDYAEAVCVIFSFNLLEIPAFHHYVELKATRDILIHNRGVANDVYQAKVGSHSRTKTGQVLPMTGTYFLHGYEACLSLTEGMMERFHDVWPSPAYEKRQTKTANQTLEPTPMAVTPPASKDPGQP